LAFTSLIFFVAAIAAREDRFEWVTADEHAHEAAVPHSALVQAVIAALLEPKSSKRFTHSSSHIQFKNFYKSIT
jgi:hypothetical protein